MTVAYMETLEGAENVSLPRISVRFTDTLNMYFIRKTISFVILQVQALALALLPLHVGFWASLL